MLRQSLFRPQATARLFSTTPARPLARTQIIGRLAAEPEVVPTASGRDVIRYAVGTSYGPASARETSWFKVAAFEDNEARKNYLLGLPKGALVHVDADSRMRSYEDADGKKRTQLDLVQRSIELLSRPQNRDASTGEEAAAASG